MRSRETIAEAPLTPTASAEEQLKRIRRALFYAALAPGLYQAFSPSGYGFGPGYEMVAIARSILHNGCFGNPFAVPTGPTAAEPPLYPFFLAGLIKLFGSPFYIAVATSLSVMAQATQIALLPRLSLAVFGDLRPGLYGAALSVLAYRMMPNWDTAFTACGVVAFCVFSVGIDRSERPNVRAAWAGVFAGLLFLLNPSTVLVSAPWSVFLVVRSQLAWRRALARCSAALFLFALVCSPWIIRNDLRFGAPIVRSNLGMTLFASNADCALPSLEATLKNGCYASKHPNMDRTEANLLATLGEAAYDRRRIAAALGWVRAHPVGFARLARQRAINFWFPPISSVWDACVWVLTALSLPGLIVLYRKQADVAGLLAGIGLLYPTMYYFVVSDVRYRYPILWISALCAGYAVFEGVGWARRALSGPRAWRVGYPCYHWREGLDN